MKSIYAKQLQKLFDNIPVKERFKKYEDMLKQFELEKKLRLIYRCFKNDLPNGIQITYDARDLFLTYHGQHTFISNGNVWFMTLPQSFEDAERFFADIDRLYIQAIKNKNTWG